MNFPELWIAGLSAAVLVVSGTYLWREGIPSSVMKPAANTPPVRPVLDAHENGPRCAQISGPTVGARQRSPAVDLLVANEGWVIVLCQDRSRRRRWPKASLYKGLSPSHARPTDGHIGVCPARGCPRETRQSAPGWWVRKMSTPWVHSRERQGTRARSRRQLSQFFAQQARIGFSVHTGSRLCPRHCSST